MDSEYGPLICALALFFLVYVGLNVWADVGIWYKTGI